MTKSFALRVLLAAAAVSPALAVPGRRSVAPASSSSVPVPNPAGGAAPTTTQSAGGPTETIIVATLAEGAKVGDKKAKWLTYLVTGEPDWCNGANSSQLITDDVSNHQLPGTLYYGTKWGDPEWLNDCSYDSFASTWGCKGWSASCSVVTDNGNNGKSVATCDGEEVLEMVTCTKDASATSASQTLVVPSGTASANPAYTSDCQESNRNSDSWKDNKMDDLLQDIIDEIPTDYEDSFLAFVRSKASGVDTFDCDISSPDGFPYTCDVDLQKCTEGENARYYFVLRAISHFHDWATMILDAIERAKGQFASDSEGITHDFVRTDLPDAGAEAWVPTLLAGLLGAVGGIMGGAAAVAPELAVGAGVAAGAAGAASGGTSFSAGIISSAMESADGVIQNELDSLASVQDYITTQLNATQDAISDWANTTINGKAGGDYIHQNPNMYDMLLFGKFASDKIGGKGAYDVNESALKYMWSAAISYIWSVQEGKVFIAKLSGDLAGFGHVCDIFLRDDISRVCDGDTAYFFMPVEEVVTDYKKQIYGADDDTLKKYGTSLLDLAKGANYTQSTFGFSQDFSDSTRGTIKDTFSDLGAAPEYPFTAIPFCDLDAIEKTWNYKDAKARWGEQPDFMVVRYIALQSCSSYTVNGQSWPMGDKDGFATSDRFPWKSNLA